MGVSTDSLQRYIREEVQAPFAAVARLSLASGKSLAWLATGREAVQTAAVGASQDLSEEALSIALEITDDIIRTERDAGRAGFVPRSRYARLVRLMYQGVTRGLPVADVYEFGRSSVRAAISGTSEGSDVGQQGVDEPGQGRDR